MHATRGLAALLACAAVAVAVGWNQSPSAFAVSGTDVRVAMDDGVELAGTLYLPDGVSPTGGWPGIVMLHGVGGTRAQVAPVAERLQASGYAVYAYDARAHGQSGGLFSAAGPREIADLRAVRDWLAARPEVSDSIGAWGVSYGGGQILRALTEGAAFRAAVVAETWTDLYSTLLPGNLAKSGVVFTFLNSVPAERRAPEVNAIAADALASRNLPALRAFADRRSSRARLSAISAPVLVLHGRRDFAIPLEQGLMMSSGLPNHHQLYVGPFGHSPSRFPGPDIADVLARTVSWFDGRVKAPANNGVPAPVPPVIVLASDPYAAGATRTAQTMPTRRVTFTARATSRIGGSSAFTRGLGRTKTVLETYGQPLVTLRASGTFPHVVAVLKARTPSGQEITVSAGGARVRLGARARNVSFRLIGQVTTIPRGSRLSLRIGSTSGDLLYLVPAPQRSRLTVSRVAVALPVLRRPVSTP